MITFMVLKFFVPPAATCSYVFHTAELLFYFFSISPDQTGYILMTFIIYVLVSPSYFEQVQVCWNLLRRNRVFIKIKNKSEHTGFRLNSMTRHVNTNYFNNLKCFTTWKYKTINIEYKYIR